jgi:hypothetical protein
VTAEPSYIEADATDVEAQIKHYGIVRVPADTFEFGGFRYSNPKDAVAAALRQERAASGV